MELDQFRLWREGQAGRSASVFSKSLRMSPFCGQAGDHLLERETVEKGTFSTTFVL
jgi:hypothetical protein